MEQEQIEKLVEGALEFWRKFEGPDESDMEQLFRILAYQDLGAMNEVLEDLNKEQGE